MRVVRAFAVVALALVIAGCGAAGPTASPAVPADSAPAPSAGPDLSASPAAGDTTQAEIEELLAQAMSQPIDLSDPGSALDRAEQGARDFMRRTGGVAQALGPSGAASLAEIDAALKQAIAALIAEVNPQSVAPGAAVVVAATTNVDAATVANAGRATTVDVARQQTTPVAAQLASVVTSTLPGSAGLRPEAGFEALGSVAGLTMLAPYLFANAPRDANGNAALPTVTEDKKTEHGLTIHLSMKPTLNGSKLTAEVEMVIDIAGPPTYQEKATGKLTVELCPDPNGNVALELSLGGGFSLFGGGMQYNVAVTATGHVDDSGKLASFDARTAGSLATQPMTNGEGALGAAPKYVEMSVGYSAAGDGSAPTNISLDFTRASSKVDLKFAQAAFDMIRDMGHYAAFFAMNSAERLWTNGYCLAIAIPEITGSSKRVDPGSETPFTAVVSHKFETTQLRVPVTATLASGTVSVTPSGTKVPSPASFRYKAPGELDKTAAVLLETRSKRGIATLTATFLTASPGWIYRGMDGAIAGRKCDGPGGDWVEEVVVKSLGMTSKWVMTIDESTLKGTYTMDATQKLKGGSGIWHGTGRASVTLGPDGTAEISLSGGKTKVNVKTSGGSSTQTVPGPEGQHSVWMPAGDECR